MDAKAGRHTPRRPTFLRVLSIFGATAFVFGLFDALVAIGMGFQPGEGFRRGTLFTVVCAGYGLAWGLALGGVCSGVVRLAAVFGFQGFDRQGGLWWRGFRLPGHIWLGAILGGLWTGLIFVFVFQLGPLVGFSFLGGDGFMRPFQLSHGFATLGILSAGGVVFGCVYRLGNHHLVTRWIWGVGVLALGWQVFYQVQVVSYLPPTSWVHGVQTLSLLGLAAASWLAIRWEYETRRLPPKFRPVAVVIGLVALITPLASTYGLERMAGDQLRLQLHERTAITARLLDVSPVDLAPPVSRLPENCEFPAQFDHRRSSCPDFEHSERLDGVILIVVDTLREDRLSKVIDGRSLMPNLQQFAAENHVFERAYAPSASTRRSFGGMLSGRIATRDKITAHDASLVDEKLRETGVWRGAVPAHDHLLEFVEDFDYVDESVLDGDLRFAVTGQDVTARGVEALEQAPADEPFFLLLHYYDPHDYYIRHDEFDFGWSMESRYNSEVAYVDNAIGELLDRIDSTKLDKELAVIVTSDHGEEFLEHRHTAHGVRVYEETVRVPLIVDLPFDFDCVRCDQPVSLVDLAPTIAGLLGAEPGSFNDVGATCLYDNDQAAERPILLRAKNRKGVVYGTEKYIEIKDKNIRQFYDLAEDPNERFNLIEERPKRAKKYRCFLDENREEVFLVQ